MVDFAWVVLLLFVALISTFFTVRTVRIRRRIFIMQCASGALVAIYGQWKLWSSPHPTAYFVELGLPYSAIVVISLCFAALTVEKAFPASTLKKWVYPVFSVYFAGWATIALLLATRGLTSFGVSVQIWHTITLTILAAAFSTGAIFRFRLALFQVFLPLLFVCFVVTLVESYIFDILIMARESVKRSFQERSSSFTRTFLSGDVWLLFQMFAYLFVHTKANKAALKQNAFVEKLPMTGVVLAVSSFIYHFPEFKSFRKFLPLHVDVLDYTLITLDLSMIPLFLLTSGWPYARDKAAATLSILVIATGGMFAVSASLSTPFRTTADSRSIDKVKTIITEVASWDPDTITKHMGLSVGRMENEKEFRAFSSHLGPLKGIKDVKGEVYTLWFPRDGLTNFALFSVDTMFVKGNANFYIMLAQSQVKDWHPEAIEFYTEKYFFSFHLISKEDALRRGYQIKQLVQ
jgi:hypothetical protein